MNKIVVVIPTLLTREALLLRTIDSVLTQTRSADHIVISCDADERRVGAFAALCKARFAGGRIKIVANHGPKGISENINNAVSKLIGFDGRKTIVSLLDDDDYWRPDYLFHVEKKMQEGATFVAAAFAYVNEVRGGQGRHHRKLNLIFSSLATRAFPIQLCPSGLMFCARLAAGIRGWHPARTGMRVCVFWK